MKQLDNIYDSKLKASGLTLLEKDDDFGEDKATKLQERLSNMTYKYICIEFDSDKKVKSVYLERSRRGSSY